MDDFTPYGTDFDKALSNLEKVLERCIASRLCLSLEKCHMMMTEGVVLGHYVSIEGIKVDPTKIEVILNFPTSPTQTEVCSFLSVAGYYHRFIEKISRIVAPLNALTGNA
jgi:hypothetical protein